MSVIIGNQKYAIIGNQEWVRKNLNTDRYANGDLIPEVTDPTAWGNLTTGAWCYYNNDPANGSIYGKIYNWYAVTDPKGLAPVGYHIPTDAEWTILTDLLGGETIAGGKMKERGTEHWNSPNISATNSSKFTGFAGGLRYVDGAFYDIGSYGSWWSYTEYGTLFAWGRSLYSNYGYVSRGVSNKTVGFSVRLIKD